MDIFAEVTNVLEPYQSNKTGCTQISRYYAHPGVRQQSRCEPGQEFWLALNQVPQFGRGLLNGVQVRRHQFIQSRCRPHFINSRSRKSRQYKYTMQIFQPERYTFLLFVSFSTVKIRWPTVKIDITILASLKINILMLSLQTGLSWSRNLFTMQFKPYFSGKYRV